MSQFFSIHPDNPQPRLIRRAADLLREGALIAYPTDTCYALGCHIDARAAADRLRAIRELGDRHHLTLACRSLAQVARYARMDNAQFRFVKARVPGPFVFILPATREVPRRLQHAKRSTIGVRLPDHRIVDALLDELDEPLLTSTLLLPGDALPLSEPDAVRERLERHLDLIVDAGPCKLEPSTIVDLTGDVPVVVRKGLGPIDGLEVIDGD